MMIWKFRYKRPVKPRLPRRTIERDTKMKSSGEATSCRASVKQRVKRFLATHARIITASSIVIIVCLSLLEFWLIFSLIKNVRCKYADSGICRFFADADFLSPSRDSEGLLFPELVITEAFEVPGADNVFSVIVKGSPQVNLTRENMQCTFHCSSGDIGSWIELAKAREKASSATEEQAVKNFALNCTTPPNGSCTSYVQVTGEKIGGTHFESQKYFLLRSSPHDTAKEKAAVCAWNCGYTSLTYFVEWMEWMIFLGFERVFIWDYDNLKSVWHARDYYAVKNKLTVLRLTPAYGYAGSIYDSECRKYRPDGVRSSSYEARDSFDSELASHCLDLVGRRYLFVAILALHEVIIPFDELSLVGLMTKLVARDEFQNADIFQFPGATYYRSFLSSDVEWYSARVLTYDRRTRLTQQRGRCVYHTKSLRDSISVQEWLSKGSETTAYVSSLYAWARRYDQNCWASEGYESLTCTDVYWDDPQWLAPFKKEVGPKARKTAESMGVLWTQ